MVRLAAVDPKVVVAMGDLACRLLTGRKEAVSRIRGRAIPLDGRYVFPTLSPSLALYTPADRALMISDFSRLPELLEADRPLVTTPEARVTGFSGHAQGIETSMSRHSSPQFARAFRCTDGATL